MSDPIMLLIISKKLLTLMTMEEIETFIRDNYSPMITESKLGMTCLFKHKDGLTDDGVVFFEFAKKQWSNKPIMNKRQYVIVDADMRDVLDFLSKYYNLTEDNYNDVRKLIVTMSIEAMDIFYGD
jgi:hypothetical protein